MLADAGITRWTTKRPASPDYRTQKYIIALDSWRPEKSVRGTKGPVLGDIKPNNKGPRIFRQIEKRCVYETGRDIRSAVPFPSLRPGTNPKQVARGISLPRGQRTEYK